MADDNPNYPSIKDDIVLREEDDGAFIFDPIKDILQVLNGTGLLVFKELNGKNSIDDIAQKLQSEYPEMSPEAVKQDVTLFIEQIRTRGFLAD
jgi:hypothetical protein